MPVHPKSQQPIGATALQQVWQHGEVHCHPPRFVPGEPICCRSALRFIVKVEITEGWPLASFSQSVLFRHPTNANSSAWQHS
jgi:hypothetical protein